MIASNRKGFLGISPAALCVAALIALSGCGGGDSGTKTSMNGEPPPPAPMVSDIDLMGSEDLAPGTTTLQPGESRTVGHTTISCPAGGAACVVEVKRDEATGQLSATSTGGVAMVAYAPPPPAPTPGPGQTISGATPVYADGTGKTIRTLLPDGTTTFAPISSAITRDFGASTTAVAAAGIHVKTVRSDGANGFHVTFVHGDQEETIHFEDGHFVSNANNYQYTNEQGARYFLWSFGDAFRKANRATGFSGYDYFTAMGGISGRERFWFVFGARTPDAAVPGAGSAGYEGWLFANTFDAGNPSNSERQRLYGHMKVVANFDLGRLEGVIRNIRGTEPGASGNTAAPWPTSSFAITDGRFVNGQFTATLTGRDSDPNPSLGQSAAGYVGNLLGELYGPNADEMSALLTATRDAADDAHDRVLEGYVYSRRVAGPHSDDAPLSTGVDRHLAPGTSPRIVSQDADNRVTAISSDGVGGYRITYLANGQSKTVELRPEDGQLGTVRESYTRRDGAITYYFRARTDSKYASAADWSHNRYEDADSDVWVFGTFGKVVHGSRTPAASMPSTGSATYLGSAYADVWEPSPANASVRNAGGIRGSLALSADFAAGSISGRIDNLARRMNLSSPYSSVSGQFAIDNGAIQGNGLTADLSGLGYSGAVRGAFYGPAADEAAGVMEATGSDSTMLHGRFIGTKQ